MWKYTNLRNTAGQSARKRALMAKVKIGLKPPHSNNSMTATEPCWTWEGGELLRRWKFSDNFLRPSGHHPLWHVTRLTLEVVELSKWRNIWKLRSGSTADYYDQRPRLVTSLSRCVDFVYMPHTHYHVKMFQNKAKKFHWFEKKCIKLKRQRRET